jgi:hypothetical protein
LKERGVKVTVEQSWGPIAKIRWTLGGALGGDIGCYAAPNPWSGVRIKHPARQHRAPPGSTLGTGLRSASKGRQPADDSAKMRIVSGGKWLVVACNRPSSLDVGTKLTKNRFEKSDE